MNKIKIISQEISPRLKYICQVIFQDFLGANYSISSSTDEVDQILIHYGNDNSQEPGFHIPCSGLLEESNIHHHDIQIDQMDDLPLFYKNERHGNFHLPFDLFAMCFFLLSRYEEYLDTPRDTFGRYQSAESIAVKNGFIQLPIVDIWVKRLAQMLNKTYGSSLVLSGTYRSEVTMDIDLPYAFKAKGIKTYLGFIKDLLKLDYKTAEVRIKYWFGGNDPFDTYSWLRAFCSKRDITPKFFILNKFKQPHDENHLANKDGLSDILQQLADFGEVGIHPSLSANNMSKHILNEIQFVEKSVGHHITQSRQHFLHLDIRKTYNSLIDCGIKDDYSMGYPDVMGFRAGTSRPYLYYDLKNEKMTDLVIHPCITMDVTMKKYLLLSPSEAIQKCEEMVTEIRNVNGTFSFIWHNSSLSQAYGWSKWREVFIHLAKL